MIAWSLKYHVIGMFFLIDHVDIVVNKSEQEDTNSWCKIVSKSSCIFHFEAYPIQTLPGIKSACLVPYFVIPMICEILIDC